MSTSRTKSHRSLFLFYVLVAYICVQFAWWAYHIISLADQLNVEDDMIKRKIWMITGEAVVFFGILMVGVYYVRKSFKREIALNQRQRNFVLSVTHELKTPIASSKLFIETMMSRELPDEKKKELLSKVYKDQDRLQVLVENILMASQLEESSFKVDVQETNLKSLIEQVIDQTETSVVVNQKLNDVIVSVDPIYFTSVIQNLHDNAIKYGGNNIVWSLEDQGDKALISIKDDGNGISGEDKQKVFDMFFRSGDENTRSAKGTGLGLYLVKKIIIAHGGTIKIKDNEPTGALFEILI